MSLVRAGAAMRKRSLSEQLQARIVCDDGCWIWSGVTDKYGYGQIPNPANKHRKLKAHRVAYECFVGPIPAGLHVLHSCDHPACVNPQHLHVGTHAQNMREAVERGRTRNCGFASKPYRLASVEGKPAALDGPTKETE